MFSNNGNGNGINNNQFSNPQSTFQQAGGVGGGQSDWFAGGPSPGGAGGAYVGGTGAQQQGGPIGGGGANSAYNPNFNSGPIGGGAGDGMGGQMNPTSAIDFDNEPPLLEELGVNIEHIVAKTKAVMNPGRIDSHLMDDTDMAGPLVFCLVLGFSLMLAGKLHFGYIYGFGVFGCIAMSTIVNLMSKEEVETWRVFSILGYCLLPVNVLAVIAIIINLQGTLGMILSACTISWCTFASTRLFDRCVNMRQQRFLIAYPIALLYSCFVMITIF